MRVIRGLEHLSYRDGLPESWDSEAWRRPQGDLIAAYQYLKSAYSKAKEGLLIKACSNRTRGMGFF